jgi:hypothetical protein
MCLKTYLEEDRVLDLFMQTYVGIMSIWKSGVYDKRYTEELTHS